MKNDMLDLKRLEKKAFQSTHQDGLWDIYMGGILMSMAVLAYSDTSDSFPLARFAIFLAGLAASGIFFWAGKKFLTAPRLGQVKFGPLRQRRKKTLALVLGGIVLFQAMIVIGTSLLWQNPQWAANLRLEATNLNLERLLVAVVGALFVGPSIALIAYFNDFYRGYYIAFVASLGVFSLIWFNQPGYLIAAGLVIVIPGAVLFARFLLKHPLPHNGATHA